jgi:hypothetical protein
LKLPPWKEDHAFGVMTWIAGEPGEEVLWLKDLLPFKVKNARVLLFGYNSNVGLDTSTAGVTGAADDLLAKLKIKRKVKWVESATAKQHVITIINRTVHPARLFFCAIAWAV